MILITGGAGYIGSHVVKEIAAAGFDVVILDNLSTGNRVAAEAVRTLLRDYDGAGQIELVIGDCGNESLLDQICRQHPIDAVIHLAAFSEVGESMRDAAKYFSNNTAQSIYLLNSLKRNRVDKLVFSSTAAVYGQPLRNPIPEEHPLQPSNVYGLSKMMIESMLPRYRVNYGLNYISLRYFNAAGADASGLIGEKHRQESHLIPLVILRAMGRRDRFTIFGDDYDTYDGTCLRDYIHVSDLAQAHLLALQALLAGNVRERVYNLGNGRPHSVREVIAAVEQACGRSLTCDIGPRRLGDPSILLASSQRAVDELGWKPQYPHLQNIVDSAWRWHRLENWPES
jgi:UDP-glucose 4-epimerase